VLVVSGADPREFVTDRCLVELRPNDFDWTGQLNNAVHAQLMEVGRWRWAAANDVDLRYGDLVAVVVSLRVDYLKPVAWDPVRHVAVRTGLAGATSYSFTLSQDIEHHDGTVYATGRVRLALVSRATQQVRRADLGSLRSRDRSTA
jgi:acyl-CoA thioesterase FadM